MVHATQELCMLFTLLHRFTAGPRFAAICKGAAASRLKPTAAAGRK
jgi:hypothetical protein